MKLSEFIEKEKALLDKFQRCANTIPEMGDMDYAEYLLQYEAFADEETRQKMVH